MDHNKIIIDTLYQIQLDIKELRNEVRIVRETQIRMDSDVRIEKAETDNLIKAVDSLKKRTEVLETKEIGERYVFKYVVNFGKVLGVISIAASMIYTVISFLKRS